MMMIIVLSLSSNTQEADVRITTQHITLSYTYACTKLYDDGRGYSRVIWRGHLRAAERMTSLLAFVL